MKTWKDCKRILCIRPDNMGDLIMSGPAIRALKHSFNAHITVLTSSMAAGVAKMMPEVDDVMIFDLPWVKTKRTNNNNELDRLIATLRTGNFDAAVIFTVFSQNPLPTALIAYQAGIPLVLGYCRENPYGLLTDWVPDEEPYTLIRHQVERDLHLVQYVGANVSDTKLHLQVPNVWLAVETKLQDIGLDVYAKWVILHPGVSELKRQYPLPLWIEAGKQLAAHGYQLLLTGAVSEQDLTAQLHTGIGNNAFDTAGLFNLEELVCLIKHSSLLLSVNTGTVHIAAAVNTPAVVLYAQTNPQHTPWLVPHYILQFPVSEQLQSKNEVVRFMQHTIYKEPAAMPAPVDIVDAVNNLFKQSSAPDQQFHETLHENRATAAS